MHNYSIVLGGLESSYMRKLALYLKNRLAMQVQVEISKEEEPHPEEENILLKIWVGSEAFIQCLRDSVQCQNLIVLTEEDEEDETHVFKYQSCEKLYRGIWMRCQKMLHFPDSGVTGKKQRWLVLTTDSSAGILLAFSVVCAQILGEKAGVLYVNLSECCGMEELFSLEHDLDLSDLFLELRKGKELHLEAYTGRMEQADYLMPVGNPMVLHEIGTEDMNRFLNIVRGAGRYEWVVFAVGNTLCGCEQIFGAAERIFHLSGNGIANSCARNAWLRFIRQCQGVGAREIEQIPAVEVCGDSCGSHLIYEWLEGTPGRLARKYLEKRNEDGDGYTMAGDQKPADWRNGSFPGYHG